MKNAIVKTWPLMLAAALDFICLVPNVKQAIDRPGVPSVSIAALNAANLAVLIQWIARDAKRGEGKWG